MRHYMHEPAASVFLGQDGAPVTGYEDGLTSDKLFDGKSFCRMNVMALCSDGETVSVSVPGTVDGLTPQLVQTALRNLSFVRVKFTGLTLEVKGDSYNKVNWKGTAEKAEVVKVAPVPGSKS